MSKTYERNLKKYKFDQNAYELATQITRYYADAAELQPVRIEERTLLVGTDNVYMATQTISGSNYSAQWPTYNHYVVYQPWAETTESGSLL